MGTVSGTQPKFLGIRFTGPETPFDQGEARQVARSLIDRLAKDKRLHSELGVSVSQPKTLSSNADGSVWHEADPLNLFQGLGGNNSKPPHLNFTIGSGYLAFGLTFPNATFAKTLEPGIKHLDEAGQLGNEFESLLKRFLALERFGIAFSPYCYLEQKHFLSQKARPRQDADLRFDLRVLGGHEDVGIRIKANPVWINVFKAAVLDRERGCHLQAGFGITIPFERRNNEFLGQAEKILDALIMTWGALLPFARALARR